MGYLYRHKLKGGTKEQPRFSSIWWCKYYRDGIAVRESTGTEKWEEARRILKDREGRVAKGEPILPRAGRIRYEEARADLVTHYRTSGSRDPEEAGFRLAHLDPFFAGRRLAGIGPADAAKYAEHRQGQEVSNGTINRELAILNRMLRLAYENGKLLRLPLIRQLQENGPRQGFFEEDAFGAVLRHLKPDLRPVATFAYLTGWRVPSEVLLLTWAQVDFRGGEVRLEPGTTKNDEGRTFPLFPELRALLERQRAQAEAIQREQGRILPQVFFRTTGKRRGRPIRNFRRAWMSACKAAGQPGRIPHDFRRTAVRNMVRLGIPERVAMTLTGHKTRSVFERYNIVSEGDLREAGRKLEGLTQRVGRVSGRAGHFGVDAASASV